MIVADPTPASVSDRGRFNVVDLAIAIAATLVTILPLWLVRFAPLHDFPFHLARMQILADLIHGGGQAEFYALNPRLVANLGMDAFVMLLATVLPVEAACRLAVVAAVFLPISGTVALHRALFGHRGLTAMLAALLSYNVVFTEGFINYLMGVGLMLWAVAIFVRGRERSAAWHLVVGVVTALVVVFTHLVAFVLYAVIVGAMALQAHGRILLREPGRALGLLAPRLLPIALVLGLLVGIAPPAEEGDGVAGSRGSMVDVLRVKVWLLRHMLDGWENHTLDVASIVAAIAVGIGLICLATPRVARASVLAIALLGLTFLLAPDTMRTGAYIDLRLPIAIVLFMVASIEWRFRWVEARAPVIVALGLLLAVRTGVLVRDWLDYARTEQRVVDSFGCLPGNAVLFVARGPIDPPGSWGGHWQPPLKHVASLATVTDGVFVPQTWAHPAQQPIVVRPEFAAFRMLQTPNPLTVETAEAMITMASRIAALTDESGRADGKRWAPYLLVLEPGRLGRGAAGGLTLVREDPLFLLYRVTSRGDNGPEACRR